jgi:hypothetical protein
VLQPPRLKKAAELSPPFYLLLPQDRTAFSKLNNRSLLHGHAYGPMSEDETGYFHGPIHRIQVIQQHPCIFRQHLLSTLLGEA